MAFQDLERFGDNEAVRTPDGGHCGYADLARHADAFARALGPGKRLVFLLCGNNLASLAAYVGCLRSGHVPLLLQADIAGEQLASLVATYRPWAIWRPGADPDGSILHRFADYALREADPAASPRLHPELGLLLSTSGSTGSPKLVRLSRANLEANAASIAQFLGLGPDDRAITVLPISYSYGLSVINSHLGVGATLLLTDETVMQSGFWDFFRREAGTSLAGVPYTYKMFQRLDIFRRMDLPSLRTLTQAGGRLPAADVGRIAAWSRERGVRFFVMYGQTEATARMSYLPCEQAVEKSESVGIAIPGGRFTLLDEDGREIVIPDQVGELVYHGPNVSLGYATAAEDLALGDLNHGRLSTGDMARWDADGYVYITGRLKRFIKVTGNRIGLDDVESRLQAAGLAAICGGRDDLLCIATTDPRAVEEIRAVIGARLGLHHSLYRVLVVPAIPRNGAGKILYADLFAELL